MQDLGTAPVQRTILEIFDSLYKPKVILLFAKLVDLQLIGVTVFFQCTILNDNENNS